MAFHDAAQKYLNGTIQANAEYSAMLVLYAPSFAALALLPLVTLEHVWRSKGRTRLPLFKMSRNDRRTGPLFG